MVKCGEKFAGCDEYKREIGYLWVFREIPRGATVMEKRRLLCMHSGITA